MWLCAFILYNEEEYEEKKNWANGRAVNSCYIVMWFILCKLYVVKLCFKSSVSSPTGHSFTYVFYVHM